MINSSINLFGNRLFDDCNSLSFNIQSSALNTSLKYIVSITNRIPETAT